MKKRGFLLGEFTLKIIIAIISIFLLIFLLVSLYSSFRGGEDKKKAEASLDRVFTGLNIAKSGEEFEIALVTPKNWVLMEYEVKLCICKSGWLSFDCDVGACREVDEDMEIGEIKIPNNIVIKYNGGYEIKEK